MYPISPIHRKEHTHTHTYTITTITTAWKSSRYILDTLCLLKQCENYLNASMDILTITLTDSSEIWQFVAKTNALNESVNSSIIF